MKKITLLLAVLISSIGFSQTTLREYTFPDASSVTATKIQSTTPNELINVVPIADGTSPDASFSYSATGNPSGALQIRGVNTSSDGRNFLFRINDDKIDYKGSTKLNVSFDIRRVGDLVGSAVNLQLQIPQIGGGVISIDQFNLENKPGFGETYININFEIDNPQFNNAAKLLIMDFGIAAGGFIGSGGTILIDNLVIKGTTGLTSCNNGVQDGDETGTDCGGTCSPCITAPTIAAPTPPARLAADVLSIYSDAYTNIVFDNFDAGWCGGAATTGITIAGNNTLKKNTGVDCHGIEFSTNRQDMTSFTYLHFDFYITDADLVGDVFNLKLINFNNTASEKSALEVNINGGTTPQLVANQWVSVDVPITKLEAPLGGSLARNDIAQVGITTAKVTNVYYDNIYLHKGTILGTDKFQTSSVKMYPNPVKNILTIEANSEIQRVAVYNILGQEVLKSSPKSNTATLQTNELQKGVYMVTTEIDGKLSTSKIVKE